MPISKSPFDVYRILIWSQNPDKLMKFYQDTLQLPLEKKVDIPGDYGYMFIVNDTLRLWLGRHSEITGRAKEPFRHMFNLYVSDSVEKWHHLVSQNPETEIIAEPFKAPFSTPKNEVWFSTFLDPEGNCFQFVGPK